MISNGNSNNTRITLAQRNSSYFHRLRKIIATMFWDSKMILSIEYFAKGQQLSDRIMPLDFWKRTCIGPYDPDLSAIYHIFSQELCCFRKIGSINISSHVSPILFARSSSCDIHLLKFKLFLTEKKFRLYKELITTGEWYSNDFEEGRYKNRIMAASFVQMY